MTSNNLSELSSFQFYHLDTTFSTKWYWGQRTSHIKDQYLNNGMRGYQGTVKFEITKGATPADFLYNSSLLVIISDRVKDIWNNFRWIEYYDVEITNRSIPFKYHGVSVIGKGGSLNYRKSKARYYTEKGGTRVIMGLKGIYFYEDQWDGSDIFYIDDIPLSYLVTNRVVSAMKNSKITNCEYVLASEVSF